MRALDDPELLELAKLARHEDLRLRRQMAALDRGGAVTDPSGITLLHESSHPDGAWADPVGGALTFKQNGQHGFVALNSSPLTGIDPGCTHVN